MKELQEIVTSKTAEMLNDGTVEKMIAKNLEETIGDSVKSALRSYSDFGKAITEKIETSVQAAGNNVTIPEYNMFITDVVNDQFLKVLNENAVEHLNKLVSEIIAPVESKAKISTLLNKIEELWGDTARENGDGDIQITTEENEDNTAIYVTFKHPDHDFYSVKASFYNFHRNEEDTWHIGYINQNKKVISKPVTGATVGMMDDVSKLLFKYYAMGTEFELDTDICSIDVEGY